MDFIKKTKEIIQFINTKNYEGFRQNLFSPDKKVCIFCLEVLKTNLSLVNVEDLIKLFKQNKSNKINVGILEIIIEKDLKIKNENKICHFTKYLKNNLKNYAENEDILKNIVILLFEFNLLENDLIDDLLVNSNEGVKILIISKLEVSSSNFEKVLPYLRKNEAIRCEILKKIPDKKISDDSIQVLMENMKNGTPKIQQTIINRLSQFPILQKQFVPLLKYSLRIKSLRSFSIQLINRIEDFNSTEIFIEEYNILKTQEDKHDFDTKYFINLIEAVSNSHKIQLFSIMMEVFNGFYSPCFYYIFDYIFNVVDDLDEYNIADLLNPLKRHKDLLIKKDFLLLKIIKILKKLKNEDLIEYFVEIVDEIKNQDHQIEIFNLLNLLSPEKQRSILEKLNLDLFKKRTKRKLELFKNDLRFKKINEFF